jgi:hypothetical protein
MNVDELLAAVNSGNSDVLMRGLLSGPNGQDKDKALNYGLLTAGLGLLGGKNIGNAGLLGLQTHMGVMDKETERRKADIAAAASLMKMRKDMAAQDVMTQAQKQFLTQGQPQAGQPAATPELPLVPGAVSLPGNNIGMFNDPSVSVPAPRPQQAPALSERDRLLNLGGATAFANPQVGRALIDLAQARFPNHIVQDRGDSLVVMNPATGAIVSTIPKGQSPDSSARLQFDRDARGNLSADQRLQHAISLLGRQQSAAEFRDKTGNAGPDISSIIGMLTGQPPATPTQTPPRAGGADMLRRELANEEAALLSATDPKTQQTHRNNIEMIRKEMAGQPGFVTSPQTTTADPAGKPLVLQPDNIVPPEKKRELLQAKPQQTLMAQTLMQNLDRLEAGAAELAGHKGLAGIAGRIDQYRPLDMFPQTRAARGLDETMKSQTIVAALQAMRDASKTGGALGNVTEKELTLLERSVAALDNAQSPKDYRIGVQNLVAQTKASMARIRSAYESTYGQLEYSPVQRIPQDRGVSPAQGSKPKMTVDEALRKYE